MALSQAIAAILESNTSLVTAMAGRMYPDVLPFKYVLPAIVFTVNNITITETKGSTTGWDDVDLTVTIHAKNRTDAEVYAGYVRTVFTRKTGSYGSLTIITGNHRGERWDYMEDNTQPDKTGHGQGVFLQSLDFRIVTK